MPNLLETLTQSLAGPALKDPSRRIGADEGASSNAVAAALPMLIEALSRNASRPEGAESLSRALERDHDGSVLGDLRGAIERGGGRAGEGILGHVLGDRRPKVEHALGRATGLGSSSIGDLLSTLAPVVMGALGRSKREQGLDSGGLASMLDDERREVQQRAPQESGILGRLLDSDGDGEVEIQELATTGFSMLSKLLGRR